MTRKNAMRERECCSILRSLALGIILAGPLCAGPGYSAQTPPSPPVFSPSPDVGWISYGPEFIPEPSGPQPVTFDPAHPFVDNAVEYNAARPGTRNPDQQSTFPVADLSNPILQPWAREPLRKLNERVLAGRPLYSRQSSCWPLGVPEFHLYPVTPTFFIQTPKMVLMIAQEDHMVRHVYLDAEHSPNPKPSWHGESVGHYEGDTLVVDTIGITTKTFLDKYRTPHSEQLHVVERLRLIEDGKTMEVKIHIEDPVALTTPVDVSQRYARNDRRPHPLDESTCGENNTNYFNLEIDPKPQAEKPDF
jgi:hypothetical protein